MTNKSETVRFRIDDETQERLNLLVDTTCTNRSVVMRELLPQKELVEALKHRSIRRGGYGRSVAWDIVRAAANELAYEMCNGPRSITLQLEQLRHWAYANGPLDIGDYTLEAALYLKWSRALAGERGYSFADTGVEDDGRKQYIVKSEDDDPGAIVTLHEAIVDYYNKYIKE